MAGAEGEFEKLAYEAALRGLDKQERLLEELRARTGVVLAASSIAASLLVQGAFRDPESRVISLTALVAFVTSIGASVVVLLPKQNLVFAESGGRLYESLYRARDDMAEVYRNLAYTADRFWLSNNRGVTVVGRACLTAALALAVEILCLAVLLGDRLL
jgi:hypothetical protein